MWRTWKASTECRVSAEEGERGDTVSVCVEGVAGSVCGEACV